MNKKVILFLNGEEPQQAPSLSIYDKIYCTDGSYHYLEKFGIIPDVVSGDFDSSELLHVPSSVEIIHTPDQNYTDFEKVLSIIVQDGYHTVDVYGASGRQQDHFLGNLNAAYKFKEKLDIQFYDNYSTYYFLNPHTHLKGMLGKTISLFPFPDTKGITTQGLLYPLLNEDLNLLDRIGTRNVANQDEVEITFQAGALLLFIVSP